MCLMMFAWQQHERYALILGANRDEFRARPAAAARWWPDQPQILAGRDLAASGTWLGITRDGQFAALTNIRNPAAMPSGGHSRGELVVNALTGKQSAEKSAYAGYNLIYGTPARGSLWVDGNRPGQSPRALSAGLHGLSNAALDDPWPKTIAAKEGLSDLLLRALEPGSLAGGLLELLGSRHVYADAELPDTGIGLQRERALSPLFIDLKDYGTRCSTVLLIEHDGTVYFTERSVDTGTTVSFSYLITPAATLV
jgi:uncharacterized protein with NRDE domain